VNTEIEREVKEVKDMLLESKKDAAMYTLIVLQSELSERVAAKKLDRETAELIYKDVKDHFIRKGWVE
jgi:hypothetical protein